MNGKQNYLNALLQGRTEWVPVEGEDLHYTGFEFNKMEKGGLGGGIDGFGVSWIAPDSGGGTLLPEPNKFLLDSDTVIRWREIIEIPDTTRYHWEADAKAQLAGIDREVFCIDYGDGNGPFERLAALMGFEEALIAMAVEPEATLDLLSAITDYKIKSMEYIAKHYAPDTCTVYDDVATQLSTFMSPDVYREMISPFHKKMAEAIKAWGVIPIMHCCGRAEDIIEDFIEEGYVAWSSVQPCNDIAACLERYGDQFCIAGGYDSNGLPGSTSDVDIIRKEIERCFEDYGHLESYIFAGFIMQSIGEGMTFEDVWAPTGTLIEEAVVYSHKHPEYRWKPCLNGGV